MLTGKIAKIIKKTAVGYPVEVNNNFSDKFREIILKQFDKEDRKNFNIIAFKNNFILYKRHSMIAYFLDDNFNVQSILKFKTDILKI